MTTTAPAPAARTEPAALAKNAGMGGSAIISSILLDSESLRDDDGYECFTACAELLSEPPGLATL
jgi:hypothetical protein